MYSHIPILRPHPDRKQFIAELLGKNPVVSFPLVEYNIHDSVMKAIHCELLGRPWINWGRPRTQLSGSAHRKHYPLAGF